MCVVYRGLKFNQILKKCFSEIFLWYVNNKIVTASKVTKTVPDITAIHCPIIRLKAKLTGKKIMENNRINESGSRSNQKTKLLFCHSNMFVNVSFFESALSRFASSFILLFSLSAKLGQYPKLQASLYLCFALCSEFFLKGICILLSCRFSFNFSHITVCRKKTVTFSCVKVDSR